MAWCPNCKEEYRSGFIKCADCGATLIDEMPPVEKDTKDSTLIINDVEPCLLVSASDEMQTKLIEGILQESGIPYFTKDRESGGYLRVYMGYSVFGVDIYVNKSDYDQAKALIDSTVAQLDSDVEKDNEYVPLDEKDTRSFTIRKTIIRIIIIVMFLIPIAYSLLYLLVSFFSTVFRA